ncbi:MAG TPA: M14 family metallopeptidase, partial [Vicinamibacterales bacterium]|nr:M14 family metallopeptidase [Vicinamibacterales bacterium]
MRRSAVMFHVGLSVVLGCAVLAGSAQERGGRGAQAGNPKPMHRVGGARDGASAFLKVDYPQLRPLRRGQLDFKHYHGLEETIDLLRGWAAQYPDLVDLYSVGTSFEGRDIWQLTITNKKAGKDTDKPAFFLEGGRHAGEISGVEATLYFINHVLTNYGKDPAITRLVDSKALYCRPNNNPDGNALYQYTAQSLRSTVRPHDDDRDGLLDEDPGEDLDGDGFVRQMRKFVGPGKGNATMDPKDPRIMRRGREGEGDYLLYSEGVDNDGDDRFNEDGIGGLDLHRNYPGHWRPAREDTGRGWTQGGAGEYPLSEPETRAVFSFLLTHPNVGLVQSLDTAVPMLLRGPSTSSTEEGMFPEDAVLAHKFDQEGLKITGYPWAGDVYHVYATRGGPNPITGEPPRDSPLFGHGPDFGYLMFGVIWYGDEIWNGGRFVDYDKNGRIDETEVFRWNDENRAGKGDFQPWTPYRHPQLGDVEIGGWNPKFYSQNPPPDLIETWARNEALFNLYLAQQLAQVKVSEVTAAPAKGVPGVFDVRATVTNEGLIPTALEMARRIK